MEEQKSEERNTEVHGLLGHLQRTKDAIIPHLLKYVSLFVLVLQNACHVLVTRYALTRDRESHPPFSKSVALFFNELIKFVASLTLFFITTNNLCKSNFYLTKLGSFEILHHHFISNCLDTLKVGVPSIIYLIQNGLIFLALENLESGTFMVTYQLKILTTALFSVLILKRRLSIAQWLSLLILVIGIALVQYYTNQKCETFFTSDAALAPRTIPALVNETEPVRFSSSVPTNAQETLQNPILGLSYVLIACFLSGFAGIYFERILKGSEVSLWLRNVQLSLLSLPVAIAIIFIGIQDRTNVLETGFLLGFDWVVWAAVLLQAIGGLVVAVVIKYADNILKAFATSVAIVVATVASIFLLNTELCRMFLFGASLVISAVVVYGFFPYRRKGNGIARVKRVKRNSEEMQVIVSREKAQQQKEDEEGEEGQKGEAAQSAGDDAATK